MQCAGALLVHTTANLFARGDSHPDFAIFTGKSLDRHVALNAPASIALKTRNQLQERHIYMLLGEGYSLTGLVSNQCR